MSVRTGQAQYAGVGSLDHGVLSRYPKILEAVQAERRGGLEWYASTCGPAPLVSVNMPDPRDKRATVRLDLSKAAEAILLAVAEPGDFTQAEWLPPTDPGHDALLSAPLDLSAPWIVAAARHERGDTCALCSRAGTDAVAQEGSALVMVHGACLRKPPDPKDKRYAERVANMRQHGFPPSLNEATQIPGSSGRIQKDDGR